VQLTTKKIPIKLSDKWEEKQEKQEKQRNYEEPGTALPKCASGKGEQCYRRLAALVPEQGRNDGTKFKFSIYIPRPAKQNADV
jgi:hypothetical protein